MISYYQDAFVEGRQILDASLIAKESIDFLLKKNAKRVICKLDIERVYDHVNSNFHLFVLSKMGFEEKWIRWIEWCTSIVRFLVLIDGTPTGFFFS